MFPRPIDWSLAKLPSDSMPSGVMNGEKLSGSKDLRRGAQWNQMLNFHFVKPSQNLVGVSIGPSEVSCTPSHCNRTNELLIGWIRFQGLMKCFVFVGGGREEDVMIQGLRSGQLSERMD